MVQGSEYTDRKYISKAKIKRTVDEFVQLFDKLYDKRSFFKKACNRQGVLDSFVQVMFLKICQTNSMLVEDELNSKCVILVNVDNDQSTSSPATSTSTDGQFYDESSNITTVFSESICTSSERIIKRGGISTLTTKTSPHVSRRR
ncbi:hypothetical protein RO3G_10508 [Rhizopus delemar RA 99-880]|uniref:Uncharacterized protein n=3 Tax=Rhizopus TaxID=4842 RepID=I1CBG8_RHIO9|nr:hypothetical protein RO3G_10508 [Rhizopus delemar RA 99-880]|eukprot:EIE85798.1 hypothetical protein RO3G_10508 [Rhizopus delemar RA 99-880]